MLADYARACRGARGLPQPGRWAGRAGIRRRLGGDHGRRPGRGSVTSVRGAPPAGRSRGGRPRGRGYGAGAARAACVSADPVAARKSPGCWNRRRRRSTAPSPLALGDYVRKNGFTQVLVGLSGGIDSALTAAIAVDALGPESVWGWACPRVTARRGRCSTPRIWLPGSGSGSTWSRWTRSSPPISKCSSRCLPGPPPGSPRRTSKHGSGGDPHGALQQVRGAMVVATGNKSEMAAGYLHALRRHGRRLRRAQGRLQDAGLPARPMAQPPGRGDTAEQHRETAFGGVETGTEGQ